MMKFGTYDIETADWTKHILGGFYDGEFYTDFESVEEFVYYLGIMDNAPDYIYSHWGGRFDFLFLMECVLHYDPPLSITNIVVMGSSLMSFTIKFDKRKKIVFRDSAGLLPYSLAQTCDMMQVENKKQPFDVKSIKKVTPELREYCFYDCISLFECLKKYFEMHGVVERPPMTRSGMSFFMYKKFENIQTDKELPYFPNFTKDFARKAYYGGRTEVFRFYGTNIKCYDINSMYPAVMRNNKVPHEYLVTTVPYDGDQHTLSPGCIADITVRSPRFMQYPLLPYRRDKLYFPIGEWRGVYCWPEIQAAKKAGYKILEVHEIQHYETHNIFKDFIDHYYKIKQKTKCPAEKQKCKDIMNHLYGRFGMRTEREGVTLDPKDDDADIVFSAMKDNVQRCLYSETKKLFSYNAPQISAYITSLARVQLWKLLVESSALYCDTDSIFTTKKFKTGTGLGELKLEKRMKEVVFVKPKVYSMLLDRGAEETKVKGVKRKLISPNEFAQFKKMITVSKEKRSLEYHDVDRGIRSFKEACARGKIVDVAPAMTKHITSEYDKRNKNGILTSPLTVNQINDRYDSGGGGQSTLPPSPLNNESEKES